MKTTILHSPSFRQFLILSTNPCVFLLFSLLANANPMPQASSSPTSPSANLSEPADPFLYRQGNYGVQFADYTPPLIPLHTMDDFISRAEGEMDEVQRIQGLDDQDFVPRDIFTYVWEMQMIEFEIAGEDEVDRRAPGGSSLRFADVRVVWAATRRLIEVWRNDSERFRACDISVSIRYAGSWYVIARGSIHPPEAALGQGTKTGSNNGTVKAS